MPVAGAVAYLWQINVSDLAKALKLLLYVVLPARKDRGRRVRLRVSQRAHIQVLSNVYLCAHLASRGRLRISSEMRLGSRSLPRLILKQLLLCQGRAVRVRVL